MIEEASRYAAWDGPDLQVSIGYALLAADAPLTAAELALLVSSHQSNVKKEADGMAERDLITCVEQVDSGSRSRPGRRPTSYGLTMKQRQEARRYLPARPAPPGLLRRGQELVAAVADAEHVPDLLRVLTEAQVAARASWVALLGEELLVAFDGPTAARPAFELLALLSDARIKSRRATVADVATLDGWLHEARRVVRETERLRPPGAKTNVGR